MRTRKMRVMISFEAPPDAAFADIREFITEWLESGGGNRHPDDPLFHSLRNVKVSKPVVPWRDPARKKKNHLIVVNIDSKLGA